MCTGCGCWRGWLSICLSSKDLLSCGGFSSISISLFFGVGQFTQDSSNAGLEELDGHQYSVNTYGKGTWKLTMQSPAAFWKITHHFLTCALYPTLNLSVFPRNSQFFCVVLEGLLVVWLTAWERCSKNLSLKAVRKYLGHSKGIRNHRVNNQPYFQILI